MGDQRAAARPRQCRCDRLCTDGLRVLFFRDLRQARSVLRIDRHWIVIPRRGMAHGAHASPIARTNGRSRAVKAMNAGLLVAAMQVLLVASVGGKFLIDRAQYPRVW